MNRTRLKRNVITKTTCAVATAAVLIGVTGCVGGSGSADEVSDESSQTVDSTKEDFIAALADMDPVRLSIPETAAEGSPSAWKSEYYKEAVEEWSGGKITVEIGYGGSFASAPEVEGAIQDGRVQVGFFYPSMRPDAYPELTKLMSVSNQADVTPLTGLLQGVGAMGESSWQNQAVVDEIGESGIVPLIPAVPQSPTQGTACKSGPMGDLSEISGRQVRISNGPVRDQLEQIGAVPVSVTTAELYEGIQRGVVDCNTASVYGSDVLGLFDLTPYFSTSDDISFVSTIGTLGINESTWESLPLAAQQLLYLKSEAFIEGYIRMMIQTDADGVETLREQGGEVVYWDDEVSDALREQYDESVVAMEDSGSGDMATMLEEHFDTWRGAVSDMGYEDGGTLADLPDWFSNDELDLDAYMDHYVEVVLAPHMPGSTS